MSTLTDYMKWQMTGEGPSSRRPKRTLQSTRKSGRKGKELNFMSESEEFDLEFETVPVIMSQDGETEVGQPKQKKRGRPSRR